MLWTRTFFFAWVFILHQSFLVGGTSPLPLSPNEYALLLGSRDSNVRVEFFVDLTCSDTKTAWTSIINTVSRYKSSVLFLFHIFPLPYHNSAFLAAKAVKVVEMTSGAEAAFGFMNLVFARQENILNSKTNDMTPSAVTSLLGRWAVAHIEDLAIEQFLDGMNSDEAEMSTRYMWKYCAFHGVTGCPTTHINGIPVPELSTLATVQDYATVIEPLLSVSDHLIDPKHIDKAALDNGIISDAQAINSGEGPLYEYGSILGIDPIFEQYLILGFAAFVLCSAIIYIGTVLMKYRVVQRVDYQGSMANKIGKGAAAPPTSPNITPVHDNPVHDVEVQKDERPNEDAPLLASYGTLG